MILKNISSVLDCDVITAAAVLWGIVAPDNLQALTTSIQGYVTNTLGWYYLLVVSLFVAFSIFLIFSPIGKIKLGKPEEKPEFSRLSWFAMLLAQVWALVSYFMARLNRSAILPLALHQVKQKQPRPSEIL